MSLPNCRFSFSGIKPPPMPGDPSQGSKITCEEIPTTGLSSLVVQDENLTRDDVVELARKAAGAQGTEAVTSRVASLVGGAIHKLKSRQGDSLRINEPSSVACFSNSSSSSASEGSLSEMTACKAFSPISSDILATDAEDTSRPAFSNASARTSAVISTSLSRSVSLAMQNLLKRGGNLLSRESGKGGKP